MQTLPKQHWGCSWGGGLNWKCIQMFLKIYWFFLYIIICIPSTTCKLKKNKTTVDLLKQSIHEFLTIMLQSLLDFINIPFSSICTNNKHTFSFCNLNFFVLFLNKCSTVLNIFIYIDMVCFKDISNQDITINFKCYSLQKTEKFLDQPRRDSEKTIYTQILRSGLG